MVCSPWGRKESDTAEQSSVCIRVVHLAPHFRVGEGKSVLLGLRVCGWEIHIQGSEKEAEI